MSHQRRGDSGGRPRPASTPRPIKRRRRLDGIGGRRGEPRRSAALERFDLGRAIVRHRRHGRTRFLTLVVGASLALLLSGAPDAASAEDSAGRIVFESDPRGHCDIWIVDADGSHAEALTDDGADDVFPVWSPDGGRIAWSRGVKGVYEIWVMNADVRARLRSSPSAFGLSALSSSLAGITRPFCPVCVGGRGIVDHAGLGGETVRRSRRTSTTAGWPHSWIEDHRRRTTTPLPR